MTPGSLHLTNYDVHVHVTNLMKQQPLFPQYISLLAYFPEPLLDHGINLHCRSIVFTMGRNAVNTMV